MLKWTLAAVVVVVGVFLVIVALQPADFRVERSATMRAPAQAPFAQRMTITESRPGERVRIRLEFFKPFPATNTAEFSFKPAGDGTAVTWSMTGQNNFIARAICLFVDMDKMVGGMFEQGLTQMKSVVERSS